MTDTDATIDHGLSRQEERINRLENAVEGLERAPMSVLVPDLDGVCEKGWPEDSDVPIMAPVMLKININNDRIHNLYSRIFNLTDRLAISERPKTDTITERDTRDQTR